MYGAEEIGGPSTEPHPPADLADPLPPGTPIVQEKIRWWGLPHTDSVVEHLAS